MSISRPDEDSSRMVFCRRLQPDGLLHGPVLARGENLLADKRAAPLEEVVVFRDRELEIEREQGQHNEHGRGEQGATQAGTLVTPCRHPGIIAESLSKYHVPH
jgi:hypothetical protein